MTLAENIALLMLLVAVVNVTVNVVAYFFDKKK